MSGDFHKIGNIKGANGVGVPEGGQRGQVLRKVGDTDFATGWGSVNYADVEGKVPKSALPDLGIAPIPVKSEAEMLNLPAVVGNMAIRTDLGKTFVLMEEPASTLSNWLELVTTSDVQSVNGQTGNVQLTKADVGLGNVDNTADADKPEATTSVRGLMPAADKAKLNNATSAATGSRLVIRDSSGGASFKKVTLSNSPSANSDAVTKSYVDDGLANGLSFKGWIGDGTDLNTVVEPGIYYQKTNPTKPEALNYPIGLSNLQGTIIVTNYYGTSATPIQTFIAAQGSSSPDLYGAPRIASRSSWNGGGNWGGWAIQATTKYADESVSAGVKPAEFQLKELQGGHVLTKTIPSGVGWTAGVLSNDWDMLRSYAQTGVVEGWVKGCPVGGKVTDTASAGFVQDPVWKLEVRPEGLNYVTQRATLLNCTPKFMIGFAWERIYNPATAKWSKWTCVGGDTGEFHSTASNATGNIEAPFRHKNTSTAKLYSTVPLRIRRVENSISIIGDMTPANTTGLNQVRENSQANGLSIAYFDHSENSGMLGCESIFIPRVQGAMGRVQQGSGKNKWYMAWLSGVDPANAFVACRYGLESQGAVGSWLQINFNYTAPQINTYTGPGYMPPAGAQQGTEPTD